MLLVAVVLLVDHAGLSLTFFRLQDLWVALGFVAALLTLSARSARTIGAFEVPDWGGRTIVLAGLTGALLLWAGTHFLLFDYPLTRDEQMVAFDMGVFRSGHLAMPLAPAWRPFANVLVPAFLLDLPAHAALISAYMPINAAARTGFSLVADPALLNPLLAAAGLVALYDVAKRIFPADRGSQAVALLLYGSSAQMLVAAMTSYAMTAHLALNLVWLALFLRAGRLAHCSALAVGFLATGLHQIVFHPLFVLPFLIDLLQRRAWRILAFYVAGYAMIGLFWLSYPHIVATVSGLDAATAGTATGAGGFIAERVMPLILNHDPAGLVLMAMNLVRFTTWQNLALLPLVGLAVPAARRREGIAQPLWFGILFTLVAMFVLLPYQGHGWGYRYLHGLIGNAALLGGYGWHRLAPRNDRARSFLVTATALTAVVAVPFLLWTTHRFVKPYRDVDAMLGAVHADMAVIDTEEIAFAIDEVRNPADLSARPIRLSSRDLDAPGLLVLCQRGSIVFIHRRAMQALGLGVEHPSASPRFDALRAAAAAAGCRQAGRTSLAKFY